MINTRKVDQAVWSERGRIFLWMGIPCVQTWSHLWLSFFLKKKLVYISVKSWVIQALWKWCLLLCSTLINMAWLFCIILCNILCFHRTKEGKMSKNTISLGIQGTVTVQLTALKIFFSHYFPDFLWQRKAIIVQYSHQLQVWPIELF